MFDHVKFGVRDYDRSKAFYLKALAPLGITASHEVGGGIEIVLRGDASLCLEPTTGTPLPLHIAFLADSRDMVDAFHRAALEAGGTDHGAPGYRPRYHPGYYAAFILDPDGHNIEAVFHDRTKTSG